MLWVHDEMLRPSVLRDAEPACFVFDEQWIADARISLKRIVFMAECLEAMPCVEVRRGDVIEELAAFAETHDVSMLRTQVTPLPRLRSQIERLGSRFEIELFHEPTFVGLPGKVDLKRFSRYWNKAKKQAFKPTGEQAGDSLFAGGN